MTVTASSLTQQRAGHAVILKLQELHQGRPDRTPLQHLFGMPVLNDEMQSWFVGAQGEIAVGHQLAKLPEGWHALHAVPVGAKDSDIDHVVIGPGGVFTVNAKHHPGKKVVQYGDKALYVGGHKQPHLRNALHEAKRAGKLLSGKAGLQIQARPVLAVVGASEIVIKDRGEVKVVGARRLSKWLTSQPEVLNADEIAAIRSVANDPATWHKDPVLEGNSDELRTWFSDLERQVQRAQSRAMLWRAGGGIAALLAAMAGYQFLF